MLLKSAALSMFVVTVIAMVGVPASAVERDINDALNQDKVVLLFLYEGEPSAFPEQLATLYSTELRYSGSVWVIRYRSGENAATDKNFQTETPPVLLVIVGKKGSTYDIRARYEEQLDEYEISSLLDEILAA
jgi:hypothetical protein